jgi:hypothetical protein
MTKARRLLIAAATAAVLLAVTGSSAAIALEELRSANLADVKGGIRIGWLRGHSVINDQNEIIGDVVDLVVGRDLSLFVVLQIGNLLGLDTYLVAVPFKTLAIDNENMRIRLPGATQKALRNFPQFHFAG